MPDSPGAGAGENSGKPRKKQSAATRAALARRRRKRHSLVTDDSKRRKQALHDAEAYLGAGNDSIGREGLKDLFKHLTQLEPSDAVLDMLMAKAARSSACEAGSISKAACLTLVARHLEYVKQEGELDTIFDEFDANKNNKLEPAELEGFLKKLRPDSDVSEADVKYVMEECDKNDDGGLERAEVLPVLAVWQTLVDEHIKRAEKGGSSACAIL